MTALKIIITAIVLFILNMYTVTSQTKYYLNSENYQEVTQIEYNPWTADNFSGTYDYLKVQATEEMDGIGYTLELNYSGSNIFASVESFVEGHLEVDTLKNISVVNNELTATGKLMQGQVLSDKEIQVTGTFCKLKYKTTGGKIKEAAGILLTYLDEGSFFFEKIK